MDILRTGLEITSSAEAIKDPKSVTFHSAFVGSRFALQDGAMIVFAGGAYVTNKPTEIAELDAACRACNGFPISRAAVSPAAALPPKQ